MATKCIVRFDGAYRFLSNFYPVMIEFEGRHYRSVEHAYQAAKTNNNDGRDCIRRARSAASAKRIGRQLRLPPGWDDMKVGIMLSLVRKKFSNDILAGWLIDTGDAELVEGNYWGDTFWGQCPLGVGHNHLGKILMQVRAEIASQRATIDS